MKGKWIAAAVAAILIAIAASAISALRRTSSLKPAASSQPVQPAPEEFLSLPARLQAKAVVMVGVPVEGSIEALHVEVGAEVYEGQLLAQIRSQGLEATRQAAEQDLEAAQSKVNILDAGIAAARLEASRAAADAARARGDLDRAARNLERQKILIAEGATPRNTYDKAQKDQAAAESESKTLDAVAQQSDTRVDNMQRELDTARKMLDGKSSDLEQTQLRIASGEIHSPVDGVVSSRRGEPGEHVDPSLHDLFQIATDLSTMQAVAEVDPAFAKQLKPGQPAAVIVVELPADAFPATITSVEGGKVVVEFANPYPDVRPGLTAQIRIRNALHGPPPAR